MAAIVMTMALSQRLAAQAPLTTDDAATAGLRQVHAEFFAQFASLPRSAAPAVRPSTVVATWLADSGQAWRTTA